MDGIGLFKTFLQGHQPQLESSNVPRLFWESLFKKLQYQTFDSDLAFQLIRIDYGDDNKDPLDPVWKLFVSSDKGIHANDPNNIYLIDHAWVYDTNSARQNLSNVPGLLDRMCILMGFDVEGKQDEKIDFVINEMWRYNQSYSLSSGSVEDRMPIWYIMDEVGSAINHSDTPNFRTVPFLYLPEGVTYTLLFPIEDVEKGEEVTRDFVEGQTNDPRKREALLLPWKNECFLNENFVQIEPDESYFLSGHILESLPEDLNPEALLRDRSSKLKVYSQYSFVNEYLNDPAFEITDNEAEADILWYTFHFKEFKELANNSPHVFVNQFPFEHVVTIKDLLSIVCRRKASQEPDSENLQSNPIWLPTTYNLSTELVQFVAYFENRRMLNMDNHWICKPWNLARGLDTHVTQNLFHILRLPSTGPKIAQKYIADPVLYERPEIGKVKFDVRYVVMLKSVKPLKVFAYKNFFLRFANKEFALNNFDQYEQHFTVMNYSEDSPLCHLKCADFILEWERQYPEFPWRDQVEPKIFQMLREVFEAAVSVNPPKGIAENPQSRAVYAADLMLEWGKDKLGRRAGVQPILLEINFSPDCKRACEYYPNFYNDIFKCFFLDDVNPEEIHDLCPDSH
nr:tubulin--tyrosine ligase-like protein 12 [Megalopta genalis]